MNKLVTYSLLSHIRDNSQDNYSSLVELFFPIVKKAIVEYAKEKNSSTVLGRSITEIREKIIEFFGIDIPLGVLGFILEQISKEVSDSGKFTYNNDQSFIINSFQFDEIDNYIESEKKNIQLLVEDYKKYCLLHDLKPDEEELFEFLESMNIDLFEDEEPTGDFQKSNSLTYVCNRLKRPDIFQIICDLYLGGLITNYFNYKIENPVAETELLIDTNFYISLIDLNTEEAFITCNQLFELAKELGYQFSILYSTVDQIKYLLNTRIQDFVNKDIGFFKEADVFGACIRRELDRSDLERIKDSVDSELKRFGIDILYETRIKKYVNKAKTSSKYQEFLEIRDNHRLSALNDTIAYQYVIDKRGDVVNEFSDVKCWFLNNSFNQNFYHGKGKRVHERFKISATELLSLLWLANPSQNNIDKATLTLSGVSTFISKYRKNHQPSNKAINDIRNKIKRASNVGTITDRDIYNLSIRMSEGHISNEDVIELANSPDEDFIKSVKQEAKSLEKIDKNIVELNEKIEKQALELEDEKKQKRKQKFVSEKIVEWKVGMSTYVYKYFFIVFILGLFNVLNSLYLKFFSIYISIAITSLAGIVPLFIRFFDHKKLYKAIRYYFDKNYNEMLTNQKIDQLEKKFEEIDQK